MDHRCIRQRIEWKLQRKHMHRLASPHTRLINSTLSNLLMLMVFTRKFFSVPRTSLLTFIFAKCGMTLVWDLTLEKTNCALVMRCWPKSGGRTPSSRPPKMPSSTSPQLRMRSSESNPLGTFSKVSGQLVLIIHCTFQVLSVSQGTHPH